MKSYSGKFFKVEEYEALFNAVNDAVAVHYFNKDGKPSNFIAVNDVMCKRYGYSREELLKMSPALIDEPETFKKYGIPGIKKLMKEGKVTFETVHVTKKGQKIPVEINAVTYTVDGKKAMLAVARDITDRKKNEEELKESNEQLNMLTNNLPGYIAYVDINTLKYEYANEAYRKSFGIPLNKIIGHHIKEVLGEEKYKFVQKYIDEVKKGKSTSYERIFDFKEGKHWIKVNYVPGFDSEGKVVSIIVMSYDITEQKNAMNTIKESEEKFRTFFKSIPVSTYTWQKKGDNLVLFDYNNMALTSTKGTIKKLIGIKLNKMYKDTSLQNRQIKRDMKQCLCEKTVIEKDMEYQLQTTSENKFLHIKYAYVPPNFVMVHTEDITERKKAEEKIRENEKRLTNVIDSTPFPIAIVDNSDEKIFYWSKSAIALFGHNPKTTAEWYDLAYPDKKYRQEVIKRWKPYIIEAAKSKKTFNTGEYNITCKDGSVKVCELYARLTDEYLIVTLNDITEKKNNEEEIINSQRLLQRIIDLLPIRIFWKDKNLKFLGCNTIFAKDAGKKSPQELIGKDDFQMIWKEQAKIYRDDDTKTINSGKSKLNYEEPQTTPKGDKIWLKTSKMPLTDLQGKTIGILGSYEDITERKKTEEELKKSKDILQSKLDEMEIFHKVSIGRELKMIELKEKIRELEEKLGKK